MRPLYGRDAPLQVQAQQAPRPGGGYAVKQPPGGFSQGLWSLAVREGASWEPRSGATDSGVESVDQAALAIEVSLLILQARQVCQGSRRVVQQL